MEKGDTDMAALFKDRNKHGNITEVMRKFYWHEMLQAVQVLQNEGIIHSDLKPPNFMLVAGHLKLIDFGIAKAIQPDHTSAIRDQQVNICNDIFFLILPCDIFIKKQFLASLRKLVDVNRLLYYLPHLHI